MFRRTLTALLFPLRMAEGDPLPPGDGDPPPTPPPTNARRQNVVCEYCECKLTHGGEIIHMGAKAKGFRQHEDRIEKLQSDLDKAQARVVELEAEIAAVKRSLTPAERKSMFSFG